MVERRAMAIINIWHWVIFDCPDPAPVVRAMDGLLAARRTGDLDFVDIDLATTPRACAFDGVLGGELRRDIAPGLPALIIGFDSVAQLEAYYVAPVHAELRRQLYSALSTEAASLYTELDHGRIPVAEAARRIEAAMNKLITRIDLRIERRRA